MPIVRRVTTALAWMNAIGGLAGFTALVATIVQSSKRRYMPDPSLRPLLDAMIEDFNTIVAVGGQPSPWFNETERRRREMTLASLHGAVVDDELNAKIGAARAEYLDCFSCSSPSRPINQVERQIDAASAGRTAAGAAIDRLNLLTRKYSHF